MAQADSNISTTAPVDSTRRRFLSQAAGVAAGGTVLALATDHARAVNGRASDAAGRVQGKPSSGGVKPRRGDRRGRHGVRTAIEQIS